MFPSKTTDFQIVISVDKTVFEIDIDDNIALVVQTCEFLKELHNLLLFCIINQNSFDIFDSFEID